MRSANYYKRVKFASFLPDWLIKKLTRFDTPGAFELPELGSSFWMDAGYDKWVRKDKRKNGDCCC